MSMGVHKRNVRAGLALVAAFVASCASVYGEIVLTAPEKDAMVVLIPDVQKRVLSLPSMDERRRLFDEDKSLRKSGEWGKSRPVVLKWAYTEKEDGPWKVEIGLASDLSDARVWYVKGKKQGKDAPSCCEMEYTVPFANLEIAKKYHWRVSGLRPESKDVVRSAISSFKTEDFAPRWIEIEGRVSNIRDLGGWRTSDGRRVRQGMAFRGQGLNDNAVSERRGRNRLMVEDIDYLTCTLGIRTDLDLRAYVLNGVLGVARHDLETDWESTFYARPPSTPISWFREEAFNDGFSKYGREGDSWSRRIEFYLLDCGITEKEIAEFRSIMLEKELGTR